MSNFVINKQPRGFIFKKWTQADLFQHFGVLKKKGTLSPDYRAHYVILWRRELVMKDYGAGCSNNKTVILNILLHG
jgi:hypothetical protein